MAPRSRLLSTAIGLVLAGAGALALARERPHERAAVLGDACHTPARVLEPAAGRPRGTAVVFHGLGASEAIMQPLGQSLAAAGWRVYLLDLAGHGRSLAPFSYANSERCAAAAVDWLAVTGRIQAEKTVFAGHSLGGAIAVRLADRLPVAATIAISPAPLVLPVRMPSNLLILAGQFDLGPVKQAARELLAAAQGTRTSRADFLERRAVGFEIVRGELHGSMVLDPRVWRLADGWAARAVGAPASVPSAAVLRPFAALLGDLALILGLVALVGPIETLAAKLFSVHPRAGPATAPPLPWRGALLRWGLAAFSAVAALGLLSASTYLRPVELQDGDWAALVALVAGIALVVLEKRRVEEALGIDPRAQAFAGATAVFLVVVFALALRPEFVEAYFGIARIWRWVVLVGFTWPYLLAEEAVLGEPAPAGWGRFFLFVGMRSLVWLAQVFALLIFWRWGLLLVLAGLGFGIVSIGQRLAADALRRRGAGPTSAALFGAVVMAGLLALVLPLA